MRLRHARLDALIAMGSDRDCAALLAIFERDAREEDSETRAALDAYVAVSAENLAAMADLAER